MKLDRKSLLHLTMREQQALQVLLDKREVYRAQKHHIAALVMGVAIHLCWQVFTTQHEFGSND